MAIAVLMPRQGQSVETCILGQWYTNICTHPGTLLSTNLLAYFMSRRCHHMTNHDISMSLYKLALSLGVRYHFNAPVEEVLVEKGRACGLRVKGENLAADLVVNNMDMVNAYKTILKKEKQPTRLLDQPKSSSALITRSATESLSNTRILKLIQG